MIMKKVLKWIGIIFAISIVIGIINSGDSKKTNQVVPAPNMVQKKEPVAKVNVPKELTTKEFIEKAVNDSTGKPNREVTRIRGILDAEGVWFIKLNADDNFSANIIKRGILNNSKRIFKQVFTRNGINKVTLRWYFPLSDIKGNSQDILVLTITMTKENASTVNWDSVLTDNLPKIADKYIEHPALNK